MSKLPNFISIIIPGYNEEKRVAESLKVQGITPVVTHPERHPAVLQDMNVLYDFIAMGALSQITAMSLTGEFGEEVQRCAQELLKHRLVHVIASDAHSPDSRPPFCPEP